MNNRNLIILVVVLIAVGALYFVSSGQRSNLDTTGGFVDLVEGTLSTDDVYGLEVYRGSDTDAGFSMARRDEDWVMSSHHDAPANVNKLRTLLGNLEGLEGEVRSDNPDVLAEYQLGEDEAIHVELKDESGGTMLHLLVGKRSGRGGFVRKDGSSEVLLASHNLLSDFGVWGEELTDPAHTSWLDLVAFKVERDEVRSIDLQWADGALAMAKEFEEPEDEGTNGVEGDDGASEGAAEGEGAEVAPPPPPTPPAELAYEWRMSEPGSFLAKKSTADAILGSLSNLRAQDVVGPADGGGEADFGLGDDAARATVALADGSRHTLLFGNALPDDENKFYFRVEGESLVWAMPKYVRDNVFKDPETLKPE